MNIQEFLNVELLVLSDKYPPDSVGGAEQSLHIALCELRRRKKLLVVTFHDQYMPKRYVIDQIDVLALPRRPPVEGKTSISLRIYKRLLGIDEDALELDVGETTENEKNRFKALRSSVAKDFLGGFEFATALVTAIVKSLRPKAMHADNYRAILIGGAVSSAQNMRRTATIRDNRFHCTRDSQDVLVKGVECGICEFQCSPIDEPARAQLQRELLEKSKNFRISRLKEFDTIIVTSDYLRNSVEALNLNKSIEVIKNPSDDFNFVSDSSAHVGELPGINLLVVGMLTENKGQVELVKRIKTIRSKIGEFRLHIAGRGERLQARMIELASAAGCEKNLVFHGFLGREQLYKLYRSCQIVLLPTLWPEPFGRVPLEAGLTMRPCVSFAVGGLRETIIDSETGFLVPRGDYNLFIDRVKDLVENEELRRRMGSAAFDRVMTEFSVIKNVDQFGRIFD